MQFKSNTSLAKRSLTQTRAAIPSVYTQISQTIHAIFGRRFARRTAITFTVLGLPTAAFLVSSSYAASNNQASTTVSTAPHSNESLNLTQTNAGSASPSSSDNSSDDSSSSASSSMSVTTNTNSSNTSANTQVTVNGKHVPTPVNGTTQTTVGPSHVTISNQTNADGSASNQTNVSTNVQTFSDSTSSSNITTTTSSTSTQ